MINSIKQDLQQSMKAAMRDKNKDKLEVIRFILAAFKQVEVDERIEVDNERALSILSKMQKERRDSISQFTEANRQDLADKENYQLNIIKEFLPPELSTEEITSIINQAVKDSGASSMQEMGKVMGIIKPKVQGRADMAKISKKIKEILMSNTQG